jgi:hypothetical protein
MYRTYCCKRYRVSDQKKLDLKAPVKGLQQHPAIHLLGNMNLYHCVSVRPTGLPLAK